MTTVTTDKIYRVKEAFYTLQGEGTHAGRPAVFFVVSVNVIYGMARRMAEQPPLANFATRILSARMARMAAATQKMNSVRCYEIFGPTRTFLLL
jgi:hypothetical protein